jgi:hypothetical protein
MPSSNFVTIQQRKTRSRYAKLNFDIGRKLRRRKQVGQLLALPTDKQQLRVVIEAATVGVPVTKCPSIADERNRTSHSTASRNSFYAQSKLYRG